MEFLKNLFLTTIPEFIKVNWYWIFAALLVVIIFDIVLLCVKSKRNKNLKKKISDLNENIAEKSRMLSTKDNIIGNLKLNSEVELRNKEKELEAIRNDLNEEIESHKSLIEGRDAFINDLTTQLDSVKDNLSALQCLKDELDTDYLRILEKNEELNKHILEMSSQYEDMEKKYNSILIENDYLKNFETENTVLIKALRRLREEDDSALATAKNAITSLETRLNKKIDSAFAAMADKIIATNAKITAVDMDNIDNLKRPELRDLAHSLGIMTIPSTWTNEKLREEIKKYKN